MQDIPALFSLQSTAKMYESLFERLVYPGEIRLNAQEPNQLPRQQEIAGATTGAPAEKNSPPPA
jgi:hypothetical protein